VTRLITALAVLLLCAGCTSSGLDKDAAPPAPDQTYFVIGVYPSDVEVSFFAGSLEHGVFDRDPFAAVRSTPSGGYIVASVKAGQTLAIMKLVARGYEAWPCRGMSALVFTAPAGRVVYLGDASYQISETWVRVRYSYDIEKARAYLKAFYPQLADRLERVTVQNLTTTARSC